MVLPTPDKPTPFKPTISRMARSLCRSFGAENITIGEGIGFCRFTGRARCVRLRRGRKSSTLDDRRKRSAVFLVTFFIRTAVPAAGTAFLIIFFLPRACRGVLVFFLTCAILLASERLFLFHFLQFYFPHLSPDFLNFSVDDEHSRHADKERESERLLGEVQQVAEIRDRE